MEGKDQHKCMISYIVAPRSEKYKFQDRIGLHTRKYQPIMPINTMYQQLNESSGVYVPPTQET